MKRKSLAKKPSALLLALALALGTAACGGDDPEGASGTPASGGDNAEPVTITIANYDQTNSFTVQCLEAFIDYATEASGGSIQFQTHYGATLCGMSEEYDYVKSGAVDMVALLPPICMSELPYIYAVNNVSDDQDVVNYTNWLWFENEETAAIVDKYCTAAGVVLLGSLDAGSAVLCTKYEAQSYDDMKSGTLGLARDFDVFQALGLNPVNVDTTEAYDSLSRGVCDAYSYPPSSYYANKIYEVAPYCLNLGIYGNSNTYVFNLEKWNSLSAEQQQILRDALAAAQEFSIQGNIDSVEQAKSVASGWYDLSEEEALATAEMMETAVSTQLLAASDLLGTTEDMLTILEAKEEYTGIKNIPDSYR